MYPDDLAEAKVRAEGHARQTLWYNKFGTYSFDRIFELKSIRFQSTRCLFHIVYTSFISFEVCLYNSPVKCLLPAL